MAQQREIHVKLLTEEKIYFIYADPSSITVEEFTKIVSEKSGIALARIRLIYMGKALLQGCSEHFPNPRSLNEAGWNNSKDSNGIIYLSRTPSPVSNKKCPKCPVKE